MIVVNGVNGSGMESMLNSFDKTLGRKYLAGDTYAYRQSLKSSELKSIAAYETYLDKFSPSDSKDVLADLEALIPDGAWPMHQLSAEMLRPVFGGRIAIDGAARMGGSLFSFNPDEVSKIYLVVASPLIIWQRRLMMGYKAHRTISLKYIEDIIATAAISSDLGLWSFSVQALEDEYTMFNDFVNNCKALFPDKVSFVNGDNSTLSFVKPDGGHGLINNRHVLDPDTLGIPMDFALIEEQYNRPEFNAVRSMWADIKALEGGRDPRPLVRRTQPPGNWLCPRIMAMVNTSTCMRCMASRGDHVIVDAKPGWDDEPCAWEVAYGPEPHKTIEKSITEHSWGVLP